MSASQTKSSHSKRVMPRRSHVSTDAVLKREALGHPIHARCTP